MRSALIPIRELNVAAAIGEVSKLPPFDAELVRLREEITSENYADFAVEFMGMQMAMDGYLEVGEARFAYTKHALTQAVSRIKPEGVVGMAGYLAVCPPELRCLNYNYWQADRFAGEESAVKGNNVLLRIKTQADQPLMRAVVSQSYVPIDDLPILSSLGSIIQPGAHMRSVRGDIRSRFDLLWPTTVQNVGTGDPVIVALRVINSETGASSVRLEPMVFHTNTWNYYMIPRAGEDVAIRHIGEARDRLKKAYDNVMGYVQPFIEQLNEAYKDDLMGRGDGFSTPEELWAAVAKCYGISDAKMTSVERAWIILGSKGYSRGHVAQSVAWAAQQLDLDDAEELQIIAGKIIRDSSKKIVRYKDL